MSQCLFTYPLCNYGHYSVHLSCPAFRFTPLRWGCLPPLALLASRLLSQNHMETAAICICIYIYIEICVYICIYIYIHDLVGNLGRVGPINHLPFLQQAFAFASFCHLHQVGQYTSETLATVVCWMSTNGMVWLKQ